MPTPDFFAFSETAFKELGAADALPAIEERLGFPLVVKPAEQGSALGIKFARTAADVPAALVAAFSYDQQGAARALRRRAATWRSRSSSDGPRRCRWSRRSRSDEDFYDFEARYEIGRTDFVCPAELPDERRRARAASWRSTVYGLLGCAGFARVDLMLDEPTASCGCSRPTRSRG